MKKILTFTLALIFMFAFALTICADEVVTDEPVTVAPDINEEITVTEEEQKGIIDTLMNSTVWVSIGTYVSLALGILVFIHKKFGSVVAMIKSKADAQTVVNGVNGALKETFAEIEKQLKETQIKLATTEENEKKLTTILCMYIMNDKFNPNAKAEIMKYITGIKEFTGTVAEICEEASQEIARLDEADIKEETPALDQIVNDANKMSLA